MSEQKYILNRTSWLEPLINQWYAWPSLISPASAAIFIANSHIRIMQSFVAAPQVHVSALKNSAMRGGPFINYDESCGRQNQSSIRSEQLKSRRSRYI